MQMKSVCKLMRVVEWYQLFAGLEPKITCTAVPGGRIIMTNKAN